MKIKVTILSGVHPNHDTLSLFDNDGREVTFRRSQIDELVRLIRERRHRTEADRLEALTVK